MFCGWPNQYSDDWLARKIKLSELPFHYVRKYHGYAFSWAVIYTFWYHPMENTYGHMMGFIHTFLVMIQGSLIYQKIHLNKYWRLLLECWVWFHGFSVAVMVAKEGKVGCVHPMLVVSILPRAEFGRNGHWEDAHHFKL